MTQIHQDRPDNEDLDNCDEFDDDCESYGEDCEYGDGDDNVHNCDENLHTQYQRHPISKGHIIVHAWRAYL